MSSLVLELQKDALNSEVKVSDLLRRALVVAKKLNIKEFEEWVLLELNGYPDVKKIPEYRKVQGEVRGWNPYHGWVPILFESPKDAEICSSRWVGQSIGEIDSLTYNTTGRTLQMPFSKETEAELMSRMGLRLRPTLHISHTLIYGILHSVRNIILTWSLKLEADGIVEDTITFSPEEKKTAASIIYNVDTYIHQMTHSQIQQDTEHSVQSMTISKNPDIGEIKDLLKLLKQLLIEIDPATISKSELEADIKTVESQTSSPKPKGSIIKECLLSIKNILEGAAGNVLASDIVRRIAMMYSDVG